MAKDSFVLYTEWANQVSRLSDEQAGVLLKAIFAYIKGDPMPSMDDKTDMCFSFIQGQLDRDSKKYEDVCEKRRTSGKKGGIANATKRKQMLPIANFSKQAVANQADNDNEYDYENENDNDDDYDDDDERKKKERKRLEERDRFLEEDDYALRHEDDGRTYFEPKVKVGMIPMPSEERTSQTGHKVLTQEERDKWTKRAQEYARAHRTG